MELSRRRRNPGVPPTSRTRRARSYPAAHLREHGLRASTARRAAHERDDAEVAREGAAVLDLHERAHTVDTRVGLDAADRAHVAGDERGRLLRSLCDHD